MKHNKMIMFLTVALACMLGIGAAFAATPGEAEVGSSTDLGEYLFTATTQDITVEAGNVSEVSLATNMSTYRWVGVVGNVSGSIILGDASDNVLYEWTALGKMVYASSQASVDWANLALGTDAQIATDYAFTDGAYSDNNTNTFDQAPAAIESGIWSGAAAISAQYALTLDDAGTPTWRTYSLHDGSNVLFASPVTVAGANDYRGFDVQFQMILPEDGTAMDTSTSTFNLWVELE